MRFCDQIADIGVIFRKKRKESTQKYIH